jgi:hypothetical protein
MDWWVMPSCWRMLFSQPCSVKIENHTSPLTSSLMPSGRAKMYSHRLDPLSWALITSAMAIATTNWIGMIATISSRVLVSALLKGTSWSIWRIASKL